MKPSWVLFDLNGTLLDPGEIGVRSASPEPERCRAPTGRCRSSCAPRLRRRAKGDVSRLRPGHRPSPREAAEHALDVAGLLDRLDLVAGSDELRAFKPDPRVIGSSATAGRVLEAAPPG